MALAEVLASSDEEATGAAGWVADDVGGLRGRQLHHQLDDVARRAELPGVALRAEHGEEVFEGVAEALAGRKLASGWGQQVLRYGPGDYAGPHNDHHPQNPRARQGYIDLHVSLCTPGVKHQWLVYSRAGHFSEIASVAGAATITAYRLPFWHYTTPLVGSPKATRWVLLGTFLFSSPPAARR